MPCVSPDRTADVEDHCHEVITMADSPVLFTPAQVRSILQLGRSKTYQLIADGVIPSISIGRSRRIPSNLLQEFIETRYEPR